MSRAKILGNAELFIKSGSDINLTCLAMQSPVPPSFIYWYKGKRVMNYSQRGGINVITERSTRTSKLLIAKATSADSGNYTCSPSSSGEFPPQVPLSPPPCAPHLVRLCRYFSAASSSSSNANARANDAAAAVAEADADANILILLSEYVSVASLVLLPLAINVTFLANGNGNDCFAFLTCTPSPTLTSLSILCLPCCVCVCTYFSISVSI